MNKRPHHSTSAEAWEPAVCRKLIDEIWALRMAMLEHEATLAPRLHGVDRCYATSARNLAHYVALRRFDIRPLQQQLAVLGLSSLGRSESHVLANLDKVLGILHRLAGQPWTPHSDEEPTGIRSSRALLDQHTSSLLGVPPIGRGVRIMVTLPSEAASDFGLVRQLVRAGMNVARINCAHDDATAWESMAKHVRRAAKTLGQPVQILMDLAGPKLRTGPIINGPAVLKLRPDRDLFGRVVTPARLLVCSTESIPSFDVAMAWATVDSRWLSHLEVGNRIDLADARGAERTLRVAFKDERGVVIECSHTAYLVPETELMRRGRVRGPRRTKLGNLPEWPGFLTLHCGDTLRITRDGIGLPASQETSEWRHRPATVPCTLPEVFGQLRQGERIWFDDGRIGGLVRTPGSEAIEVEITHARLEGERLAGDKGINLPDSQIDLPALTDKDIEDLAAVVRLADLVGLSFVHRAADVEALRMHLRTLGAADLGVILKIETRRSFENLPELLFAAMAGRAAGVMIARGDLAVECGYERLAEVQEEILWAAEAAHMPVIWATQVLETLAKTGLPSRAEVTDAAMGERAECVMLNKGPHILDAIRTLDDILRRMEAHQTKKRPLLRALRAWGSTEAEEHLPPAEIPVRRSRGNRQKAVPEA
jgi:pyruvate kinase